MPVPDRVATFTVRLIIVFASIFVVGAVAFALPSLGGRLSLPLLPSGIAVAAAYRCGRPSLLPPWRSNCGCTTPFLKQLASALDLRAARGSRPGSWSAADLTRAFHAR